MVGSVAAGGGAPVSVQSMITTPPPRLPAAPGVTEAGPLCQSTTKSAVAFGVLLAERIGDTIRVSLSAPSVE